MTRLAVVAPHRERCGVADYARQLTASLGAEWRIESLALPERDERCAWRRLARRAGQAELVQVHFEYSLFHVVKPYRNRYESLMRRLPGVRVVTLHGSLPRLERRPLRTARDALRQLFYLPYFASWETRMHATAEAFVVHTEAMRARAAAAAGADRVHRVPHPVPPCTRRWGLRPGAPTTLVTPGFVKPHKGYTQLLEAVGERTDWRWRIAGAAQTAADELYERRLRATVRSRGLAERVRFTGYLDPERLDEELASATVAVFPFETAAGSGSIAWAIAAGMPVLATDLPELEQLRDEGVGIELLPRAAIADWPTRIAALAGDPARLERLAARNRRYAEAHSYDRVAADLGDLFRRLLEAGRRRG